MPPSKAELQTEADELAQALASPTVAQDPAKLRDLARRKAKVDEHLAALEQVERLGAEVLDLRNLLATESDESMQQLAEDELTPKQAELTEAAAKLKELERPKDPDDDKPAIIEIRGGAGGDEASLFAADLYGMYQRYAESHGWPVEVLSRSVSEAGGFKEIIFRVAAPAYGGLRFEGGTHRVQRIPVTESGGRIHTSTATVAVLPEAEEVELEIKPEELRVDVFRSSGPGGQSVNTTDSAVRITHLPTGLVVTCQDEKSQHKNKAKALTILRARLKRQQDEEEAKARGDQRRSQVGTGDRSEKIRTYNFPQDRITDHRIGFSTRGLTKVLAGGLDPILAKLRAASEAA